jgi:hypothetical protein
MSFKSIFELLEKEIDFNEEVVRIDNLFSRTKLYLELINRGHYENLSIEEYIDKRYFLKWEHRKRCLNTSDFRNKIGIGEEDILVLFNSCSLEMFLKYCEYVSNMLLLLLENADSNLKEFSKIMSPLIKNLDSCLSELNMERKNSPDNTMCKIVQKNPLATIAADKLDKDMAYMAFEYNNYLLKGDIDKKRDILVNLAGEFEAIRNNIKNEFKNIEKYTGILLNEMGIRHNNFKGPKKNIFLDSISDKELEEIYDKTYELILVCINLNDFVINKGYFEHLEKQVRG